MSRCWCPGPLAPLGSRERARASGSGSRTRSGWSDWSEPAVVEAGLLDADDWTARFVSPRRHRRAGRAGARAARPLARAGRGGQGPALRHRARRSTAPRSTAAGSATTSSPRAGPATATGCATRPTTSPTWSGGGEQRARRAARQRLVPRPARLPGRARALRRPARAAGPARGDAPPTARVHVLATDGSWTARESDVLADDLYDGQRTDLRRAAWPATDRPGRGARRRPGPAGRAGRPAGAGHRGAARRRGVPPRRPARRWSTSARTSSAGSGCASARLPPGDEVVVRHAEVLEDGELGARPLRTAKATDTYLLAGADEVVLEPSLTFHGFRYAEVTGVPELRGRGRRGGRRRLRPAPHRLVQLVARPAQPLPRERRLGHARQLRRRAHRLPAARRAARLDRRHPGLLADRELPVRQRRLPRPPGWPTWPPSSSRTARCRSWCPDVLRRPRPRRRRPGATPRRSCPGCSTSAPATAACWRGSCRACAPGSTGWPTSPATTGCGRAASSSATGSTRPRRRTTPSAPRPTRTSSPPRTWPARPRSSPRRPRLVGDADAARHYADLADRGPRGVRPRVRDRRRPGAERRADRVRAGPRVGAAARRGAARRGPADRLADLVRTAGFRISTGFVGTPLIDRRADRGRASADVAYRLLLQTGCPSWLYPVTMGATTVWERWDSMLPDGSINPGEMTSFNHYALGAVADWLHRRVAGLAPAAPGYREIAVRPLPTAALTSRLGPPPHAVRRSPRRLDTRRRPVPPGGASSRSGTTATGAAARHRRAETVAHGEHRLGGARPVPAVARPAHSLTVRDVLDDQPTWSAVVAAAVETGVAPGGEAETAASASRAPRRARDVSRSRPRTAGVHARRRRVPA